MNTIKVFLNENYIANLDLSQLMHTLDVYFVETDYNIVTSIVAYSMFDKEVHTLKYAIENSNLDIVRYLVEVGKVIVHMNHINIMLIAKYGHLNTIKYLVEVCNVNICAHDNYMLRLLASSGHLDAVKYLIEDCGVNHGYELALSWATNRGHFEIVRYLLQKNADINGENGDALALAVYSGRLDIVMFIVECGADVHINNDYIIILAGLQSNVDILRYLIEDCNVRNNYDRALNSAIYMGHFEVARYLLQKNADINANNGEGFSYIVSSGHLDRVIFAVECGADIHINNDNAIKVAALHNRLDIVNYLVDQGVDRNVIPLP